MSAKIHLSLSLSLTSLRLSCLRKCVCMYTYVYAHGCIHKYMHMYLNLQPVAATHSKKPETCINICTYVHDKHIHVHIF